MKIEEEIKHCEEVAEENESKIIPKETYNNMPWIDNANESYRKCAAEHRQLAEWLKELKTHREIHDILLQTLVDFDSDICCEDLMDNKEEQKICEENCNNHAKSCWVRWAKMKAKEVNADEDSN